MNVMRVLWIGLMAASLPFVAQADYRTMMEVGASRWRNDDGNESTATWKANTNTPIVGVTRDTNIRLRFAVGGSRYDGYTVAYLSTGRLQYAESLWGPWSDVQPTDGYPFRMAATSGYTNGQPTTAKLTLTNSFVGGVCVESPGLKASLPRFSYSQYINVEYCIQATADAKRNTTYYFRYYIDIVQPGPPPVPLVYIPECYAELTIEDLDPAIPVTEVIVDNLDVNTVQKGGTLTGAGTVVHSPWQTSVNTVGAWNGSCQVSINLFETNALAFRWIPNLPKAGPYRVYAQWTYGSLRGRYIPYNIRHTGGTNEVLFNQRDPALSGVWNLLGTYTFNQGTNGWIELDGNNGQACADAVRLVLDEVLLLVESSSVNVPEGGTNTFRVRLSSEPASNVVVAVVRTAGDTGITVSSGANLTFTPANWSAFQTVTLAAAEDADTGYGMATVTCSATGLSSVNVTATEQDNDSHAGGTVVEYMLNGTNYRAHIFTDIGTNTFTVRTADAHAIQYLIVGGGGGGGSGFGTDIEDLYGGGGGAGGYISNVGTGALLSVTNGAYAIVVGRGGAGFWPGGFSGGNGTNGASSSAFGLIALGGGGGGGRINGTDTINGNGLAGASGGGGRGASATALTTTVGGAGLQPGSASGGFGTTGGVSTLRSGLRDKSAGGGGAGGPGNYAIYSAPYGIWGAGGVGKTNVITGSNVVYATGGDGGKVGNPHGVANTGNGGCGGSGETYLEGSGHGGSGVVIIRYVIGGTQALDTDGDGMPDAWEITSLGGTNASPTADADSDGMSNLNEYLAGTNPTNSASVLAVQSLATKAGGEWEIQWSSVAEKRYNILKSTNLATGFTVTEAAGIAAKPPVNTQTVSQTQSPFGFYQVTVDVE